MYNEYSVISCSCLLTLIERVNEFIADGWQPVGGLCYGSAVNGYYRYLQAMGKVGLTKKEVVV